MKLRNFPLLLLLACLWMGCQSSPKKSTLRVAASSQAVEIVPIKVTPTKLSLEQALEQGPEQTAQFVKSESKVEAYPGLGAQLVSQLPDNVKAERRVYEVNPAKVQIQQFLRKFKPWKMAKKVERAKEILSSFQCDQAPEAQSLGFSLERDFPEPEAMSDSLALHDKVISCPVEFRTDSFFRLIVFSIQQGQCEKALNYIKEFPPTPERGVSDRLLYLQGMCSSKALGTIDDRNPWGGYGVRLGDLKLSELENPVWYLSAQSGSPEWDRLLVTMADLTLKKEKRSLQYLATKIDYETLRTLPYTFQASVLTLFHFAEADLSVFQTLHRFLADHPELVTKEVATLLFPVRYWKEILANTKGLDPILVKSLIRQESAFNPAARSRARALGLMQMIYPTARRFGMKKKKLLLDPKENIRVGAIFLHQLIEKFGSVELALAAYNAGPEVVRDWQKRYPTDNIELFVEMIPYAETREYVRLIGRNYRIYQNILADQLPEKPSLVRNSQIRP